MTLDVAVYLLVLCIAGIVATAIFLRKKKNLKVILIVLLSLIALAMVVYLGLAYLFLDFIKNHSTVPPPMGEMI